MPIYKLLNKRVPTKKWLDIVEEYRKNLSLPFDTKQVSGNSKKAADMVGLLEVLNALSLAGYNLNQGFELQKEEYIIEEPESE
ncbi:MAG: hypothetical protein ACW976_06275 [Candidatus Ranarchaeia archaeon]|jgi:hypothetical protein